MRYQIVDLKIVSDTGTDKKSFMGMDAAKEFAEKMVGKPLTWKVNAKGLTLTDNKTFPYFEIVKTVNF